MIASATDNRTDSPPGPRRAIILRQVVAASLPIAAGAVQWQLWHIIGPLTFFLFYPTVFFAPMIGGLWAGIGATLLSSSIVWFVFLPLQVSFRADQLGPVLSLALFTFMGIVFAVFHERLSRLKQRESLRAGEKRFTIMFRDAPVALIGFRLDDHRIVAVSRTFERMSGYTREEIVGRTALELKLWADAATDGGVLATPEPGDKQLAEIGYRCKSGEIREAAISMMQIEMDGRPISLAMLSDATERKRAEAALRQSEERFRIVVDSGIQGLLVADEQGRIVLASRALRNHVRLPTRRTRRRVGREPAARACARPARR